MKRLSDLPPARVGTLVVSNLVPIAGVVALGWSTAVVLAVYLVEVYASLGWTYLKLPFARLRPNNDIDPSGGLLAPLQATRGSLRPVRFLPPLYLRNLPSLVGLTVVSGVVVFTSFVAYALTRPTITEDVAASLLLGGLVVTVAQGVETWTTYFRDGGYETESARTLLLTPFRYLVGFGVLFMVLVGLESVHTTDGAAVGGQGLLAVVVVGKLALDLRTFQVERADDRLSWFTRLYGNSETEIPPTPVPVPDGPPETVASPPRRVAVADAVATGLRYGFVTWGLVTWGLVAFGVAVDAPVYAVAGVAFGLALAGGRALTRSLRRGGLVYRRYPETLVVHDRLLGAAQARCDLDAVESVTTERTLVDRLFDTETRLVEPSGADRETPSLFVSDPSEHGASDATEDHRLELLHINGHEADQLVRNDATTPSTD